MKESKSFLLILGFFAASFTAVHYFVIFTGFSDLVALLLYALPSTLIIAYSITEARVKCCEARFDLLLFYFGNTLSYRAGMVYWLN